MHGLPDEEVEFTPKIPPLLKTEPVFTWMLLLPVNAGWVEVQSHELDEVSKHRWSMKPLINKIRRWMIVWHFIRPSVLLLEQFTETLH